MKNGHWKLINRATLPHEQDDIELIDKAWSDMGVIHAKPPRNAVPQGFVSTLLKDGANKSLEQSPGRPVFTARHEP